MKEILNTVTLILFLSVGLYIWVAVAAEFITKKRWKLTVWVLHYSPYIMGVIGGLIIILALIGWIFKL